MLESWRARSAAATDSSGPAPAAAAAADDDDDDDDDDGHAPPPLDEHGRPYPSVRRSARWLSHSSLCVHWVAVPKAVRARRVNRWMRSTSLRLGRLLRAALPHAERHDHWRGGC
jgi:hypothetical protein